MLVCLTRGNQIVTLSAGIPVSPFSQACSGGVCVPQVGTTQTLDSLGDRLMYRLAYRHFQDGHESLVVAHSVGSPAGIRWYEIQNPSEPAGQPTGDIFSRWELALDAQYRNGSYWRHCRMVQRN